VFGALLSKEFGRFTSSANYMLNCGLGVLLIPAMGVLLLLKGREVCEAVGEAISGRPDCTAILICAALCMLASMNDMVTPSVSLEGKNLWIPQSLPVEPKRILRAKMAVQLILTGIPMLLAAACGAIVVPAPAAVKAMVFIMPLVYVLFSAVCGMVIGIRMPLLNWTNEIVPIKQSGAVAIILFGGWGVITVITGLYLLIGYRIGAVLYLACWSLLLAMVSFALLKWLDTGGAETFSSL
jgi:ABC-2 type transport system permease protein